jgi:hypothetical protein
VWWRILKKSNGMRDASKPSDAFRYYLSKLWTSARRIDAVGCLLVFLSMYELWSNAKTKSRRLLCVLLLWKCALPIKANGES